MGKSDSTSSVIDTLCQALQIEYTTIVHYPVIAKLMPNERLATRVELLGQDSIKHADIVTKTISALGGIAPFPSFELLPEHIDLKNFFDKQLGLERTALELHTRAADDIDEQLEPELRKLADQERWHIQVVEDIISGLG